MRARLARVPRELKELWARTPTPEGCDSWAEVIDFSCPEMFTEDRLAAIALLGPDHLEARRILVGWLADDCDALDAGGAEPDTVWDRLARRGAIYPDSPSIDAAENEILDPGCGERAARRGDMLMAEVRRFAGCGPEIVGAWERARRAGDPRDLDRFIQDWLMEGEPEPDGERRPLHWRRWRQKLEYRTLLMNRRREEGT